MIKCLPENFDRYGPALISRCILDANFLEFKQQPKNPKDPYDLYEIPEFTEYRKLQTDSQTDSQTVSCHAMVLIGYKNDGDDVYFLLQNWWAHMQFCWVSEGYLQESMADVIFIGAKQENFGKFQNMHRCMHKHAESQFEEQKDGCLFDASF